VLFGVDLQFEARVKRKGLVHAVGLNVKPSCDGRVAPPRLFVTMHGEPMASDDRG
jgi:hypothetical protein